MEDINEALGLAETVEKIGKVVNFVELTPKNIKTITNAIDVVNEFNNKINSYGEHIFKSMYINTVDGWLSKLSEKDIKKVFGDNPDPKKRSGQFVFCYKTKRLFAWNSSRRGWVMGSCTSMSTKYTFIDGKLIVTNKWATQEARFDHIPWINKERRFTIDCATNSVVMSGDQVGVGY